jgi:hypothetical protein
MMLPWIFSFICKCMPWGLAQDPSHVQELQKAADKVAERARPVADDITDKAKEQTHKVLCYFCWQSSLLHVHHYSYILFTS